MSMAARSLRRRPGTVPKDGLNLSAQKTEGSLPMSRHSAAGDRLAQVATVNRQCSAGDIAGRITGQIKHYRGDLFRLGIAA